MIDLKRTGDRIRTACERRGISVRQLQKELKVGAFQSIYNWFNGRALPTLENYYMLCRLLRVPMESLIVLKGTSAAEAWNRDRWDFQWSITCAGGMDAVLRMECLSRHYSQENSENRLREYVAALK